MLANQIVADSTQPMGKEIGKPPQLHGIEPEATASGTQSPN